jgi:uncharacterized tellurite resistance protein B-like protein
MSAEDNLNCLKNLMQLMCIDGVIHPQEKAFLKHAAVRLEVAVEDWNALLKSVLRDNVSVYPIADRDKATAALKAMVLLAKRDGKLDEKERRYVLQFAKAVGISRGEWNTLLQNIEAETLFDPFRKPQGRLLALSDDFDKLEDFVQVAENYGVVIETCELSHYLQSKAAEQSFVCFHAAPEKDLTVVRCEQLLKKAGERLVCILTRFQGHQVKYLHEAGLKKCIIEPVYARDITEMLKSRQ